MRADNGMQDEPVWYNDREPSSHFLGSGRSGGRWYGVAVYVYVRNAFVIRRLCRASRLNRPVEVAPGNVNLRITA